MRRQGIAVRPLTGHIGAEVRGLDLARPLDDAGFAFVRKLLRDHMVLVFRDQELTPDRMKEFAGRFGPLARQYTEPYSFKTLPGHPEIMVVTKEADDGGGNFGGIWHTDVTFEERPFFGNALYARDMPEAGGDTLFASLCLAYDCLSATLRGVLDRLEAVHSSADTDTARRYLERKAVAPGETGLATGETAHPVAVVHPETGRKALYVNQVYTRRFLGMTELESQPLLEFLYAHSVRPEFTCRVRWEKNTLGLWDNRCTLHYAVNDYHGQRREMWRISIAGTRPA